MINLIKKLYANLRSTKITQKITGLVLTGALAFSLASCSLPPIFNDPDNPDINNNQNENNENNNQNNNENNNENNKPQREYSQIIKNIFENEEYDSLVQQVKSGKIELLQTPLFQPHPYAFLDEAGVDIESILNGQKEAYTLSYILDSEPNNLYMYTRIKESDHYQIFHIRYTLTEDEKKDYITIHQDTLGSQYYLQAFWMNNEISKEKDAEILGTSKIAFKVYDGLQRDVNRKNLYNINDNNFIATNFDKNNSCYDMIILPVLYKHSNMSISDDIYFGDDIFINPFFKGDVFTAYAGITIPTENKTPATLFLTQDIVHSYSTPYDFENFQ